MKIKDRIIVVTGASRGIGKATARALADAGGRVVLLARSREAEQVAVDIVERGGDARAYLADLTNAADVARVGLQIMAEVGAPDIVINNAGAGRWLAVEETSAEEAVAMMASPYFAAFYVTKAFLPAMLARGRGFIVNVTSPAAAFPWPGATAYAAARAAMRGFTSALRVDLHGTGVGVMLMMPGKVNSTYFEHNPNSEERLPTITRMMPTLTSEAVAAAMVRGIERDRREVIIPLMLRVVLTAHTLAPSLVEWLMCRTGWRHAASGSAQN